MNRKAPTRTELGPASAAGRPDEAVQQLVDLAHAELGRGVGLDDAALVAVAYSPQPEVVDEVRRESILRRRTAANVSTWLDGLGIRSSRGPLRLPSNPGLGMRARVCVPVRTEDELLGFLWLLDSPRRLSDEEVSLATGFAARIAVALAHERLLERRERAVESELVRQLVAGEVPPHNLPYDLLAADALVVAVVGLSDPARAARRSRADVNEVERAIEDFRRAFPPHHVLTGVDGGEGTVILRGEDPGVAESLRTRLLPLLPRGRAWIGVGRERADAAELAAAHREARLCALAAARLPALGPVVRWGSLGAYRTLLEMIDGAGSPAIVPEPLLRLRESDSAATLMPTLETYLEAAGDAKATAAAFSIHRSSLYLRLRRIEEITGMDLHRGDDQLNLHLGLRLLRLLPDSASVPRPEAEPA